MYSRGENVNDPDLGCRAFNVPSYKELLKAVSVGEKCITEIGIELGWSQPTVSAKVKLMREKGFVRIVFDGRFRRVVLSEKGRELLEK